MQSFNINMKLHHPDAVVPKYATTGAAGADVFSRLDSEIYIHPGETKLIPLGFSLELPTGFAAFLIPRSGLGTKSGIVLGNLVGLCDEDYRGEYMAAVWNRNLDGAAFRINPKDRIAQMAIVPVIQGNFVVTNQLSDTERGEGGFGSTGHN